jgi:broad specificity phosphatase PhoE
LDSPLSQVGEQRADVLAEVLQDSGISAIYCTEYIRTQQTAKPIAEKLNLKVTILKAAETRQLVDALRSSSATVVLVVGHSKSLPILIKELGGGDVPEILENDYDGLFVLLLPNAANSRLMKLHYGRPSRATAEIGH